jgi:hypothetical protein
MAKECERIGGLWSNDLSDNYCPMSMCIIATAIR